MHCRTITIAWGIGGNIGEKEFGIWFMQFFMLINKMNSRKSRNKLSIDHRKLKVDL